MPALRDTEPMTTTPQDIFIQTLQQVIGQPLAAAHYLLEDTPAHHMRGLFRFRKHIAEQQYTFIEFQMLYHDQSGLSRFRITLLKNSVLHARTPTPALVERTLSQVIWEDYQARVLPAADHWWMYKQPQDLGYALYEAGTLLFGYGVPWLEPNAQANNL